MILRILSKINLVILILFFGINFSEANFKEIKKKAKVNKPGIIFPIPKNLNKCQTKMYVSPEMNKVKPILTVKAPKGYGLDNRYDYALSRFSNFSFLISIASIIAVSNKSFFQPLWGVFTLIFFDHFFDNSFSITSE